MHTVMPVWPALLAGLTYVVTPGPGFLAMLSCVSVKPLVAGVRFAGGLLVGSAAWLVVTLMAFAGAGSLPAGALDALGIACALYLAYLGTGLIVMSARGRAAPTLTRPLREGLALSLTNPKAYPVLTAVFGGFVLADSGIQGVGHAVGIVFWGVLGFTAGYALMLGASRALVVRTFYKAHFRPVSVVFGLVFWLFAAEILLDTALRQIV
ncbi:hypothetical protein CKO28_16180 [Rhodovibrio sodomensis]|uniref:Lysine transporter LysE n=1 Tax=Rhodovibrio sodomensis TaxID=1088 RepID=A0ABS1DIM1_9PROT|nr:LysE family transporter [Rhodovibrio sodomensis]MBK1669578.1 hypothetical protein [Rhodovibrio sodomensis]